MQIISFILGIICLALTLYFGVYGLYYLLQTGYSIRDVGFNAPDLHFYIGSLLVYKVYVIISALFTNLFMQIFVLESK